MTIKNLLAPNKRAFWFASFWTLFILYLSLKAPSGESKFYFPNADKIVHFTFYFVFVLLWFRYLIFNDKFKNRYKLFLVLVAVSLGIIIEIIQHYFTTTREGDVLDALANTIGSIVGIVVASSLFKK